jgi:hypothetical protein
MLRRNMFLKYYQAADDGTGAGGAGSDNPAPVKTYTQAEVDELTKGLRESRDTLLSEKKTVAQKAKEAEEARLALELESAKKLGELDKFEQSLRAGFDKEKGELSTTLEALKGKVVGESKRATLSAFTGDFIAHESLDLISQLVKTEFDGTDVKTQFTDFQGNVITTDAAEFKKWMAKHPAISHLMKADGASGGGAIGAKNNASGGAVAKSTADILYPQK